MRANRCRTYCVEKDYSTNKLIFRPILKDCKNCEFLKKRVLDKDLSEFIEAQKIKKGKNNDYK